MKELKLTDRVVVEIFAEQGNEFSYQLIAEQLHMIADAIEEGREGGDWHDEDLTQLHGVDGVPMEVLWEHESKGYGDFRIVSDKSLIRPYYYGSEPKPLIISERTKNNVEEWLKKMYIRNEDKEYIHTDGDLVDYAYPIMKQIISETK